MGLNYRLKNRYGICLFITFIILVSGCEKTENEVQANPDYQAKIEEWQQNRIASLTKPDGWLSLTGLFWLKEGENRFGSAESNVIVFPGENIPPVIGTIYLKEDSLQVEIQNGVEILQEGKAVNSMPLKSDAGGNPTILKYKSLSWYVIKRGDKYGIRLKDSESPRLKNFQGIERFPVDSRWRVEARFEPYDSVKTIAVPTVLGTISESPSPGALVFEIDGKTYRLDPVADPGDENYFIIFADETNGTETYGAGRFLYAKSPGADGKTILDFNKSYNPPCAFTPYATCPLPPEQNFLPLRITAGEKNYAGAPH